MHRRTAGELTIQADPSRRGGGSARHSERGAGMLALSGAGMLALSGAGALEPPQVTPDE